MTLPTQPVTLTAEQIGALNQKLSEMRHEINNHLSLIVTAVELIRHKPDTTSRMLETLAERPSRISASLTAFSSDFEKILGIARS
jgi:hypothetical protein